ncbi:MAG: sodium:alanine symporter family protein [Blastochloris sp.]|nr:sodium:alanine symporter family protein [Blastochloris sp.]
MELLFTTLTTLDIILEKIAGWIWGWPLILLLFGTHLFLTIRTGVIQRHLPHALKLCFSRRQEGEGDVSAFSSLMIALAATIGTGNIYGVAGAVLLGGPGAVLWMWLTGVFGIATKYGEAVLAVKYRQKNERGEMVGGPMLVLEKGLKLKWLGLLFALFAAIAGLGIGNMNQANTITELAQEAIPGLENWMVALPLTLATGAVLIGGVRSIARVCAWLVPFMALFYGIGCIVILLMNLEKIPGTLEVIFSSAFSGHAAIGGFVGAGIKEAMRYGIARGLFSNEAGLGSAPIVAAAAKTKDPVSQGLISATGVFWDTVIICALTGLVIVGSGDWQMENLTKAKLCHAAFSDLSHFGTFILTGGLLTFVFSTILGWSYYGEKSVEYLLGLKAVPYYRWLWVIAVFVGAMAPVSLIWNFADIMNGLMALPNLISLVLLSGVIAAETKRYFKTLD